MPQTFSIDYRDTRVANRKIDELMGLCRAMVSDGKLDKREADLLFDWFEANRGTAQAPLVSRLFDDLDEIYSTGRGELDAEARQKLVDKMTKFAGAELGGATLMPTSMPLDEDPEPVEFEDKLFCFTGTFAYGTRRQCHEAVWARGGDVGEMRASTDYLVISSKVTANWRHASYGRKVVQAVGWQDKGHPIHIISEHHWVKCLGLQNRGTKDKSARFENDPELVSDVKKARRKSPREEVRETDARNISASAFRKSSRSSKFGNRTAKTSEPQATPREEAETKQQFHIVPLMILAASLSAILVYSILKPESAQSASLVVSEEDPAPCSTEVSFQLSTCSSHPSGSPAS